MKKYYSILAIAAVFAVVSCEKEAHAPEETISGNDQEQTATEPLTNPITLTFTANATPTKVSLVGEGTDGSKTAVWDEGDQVKVIWYNEDESAMKSTTVTVDSHGTASTTFTASVEEADYYYAVYPATIETSLDGEGNFTVNFPNNAQAPTSFAGAAWYAAKTTKDSKEFAFHPISTVIKFNLDGNAVADPESVYFRSMTGGLTKLHGHFPITFDEADGYPVSVGLASDGAGNTTYKVNGTGSYYFILPGDGQSAGADGFVFQIKKEGEAIPAAHYANNITLTPGKLYNIKSAVDTKVIKSYYVAKTTQGTGGGLSQKNAETLENLKANVPAFKFSTYIAGALLLDGTTINFLGDATAYDEPLAPFNTNNSAPAHSYTIVGGIGGGTTTFTTSASSTFGATKPNITLQNITFDSCDTAPAVTVSAGTLNLDHVTFINNSACSIDVTGGTASITDCTFSGNSNTANGGAVRVEGASKTTFSRCTFDNNSAASGGAFLITNNNTTSTLNNCTFTKNRATTNGAAIFANNGVLNLNDCLFGGSIEDKNEAPIGAAIQIPTANGKVYARGCSFINNNATSTSSQGGTISMAEAGILYLDKCYFKDNTFNKPASSNNAGLGFDIGGADNKYPTVCIHNTTINNSKIGEGNLTNGASVQTRGYIIIVNSTFVGAGTCGRGCFALGYKGNAETDPNNAILCNSTFTHATKPSIWSAAGSDSYSWFSDYCLIKSQSVRTASPTHIVTGEHNAIGAFTMGAESGAGYFAAPTLPAGYSAPTKAQIETILSKNPKWEAFKTWLGEEWGKDQSGASRGTEDSSVWTPGSIQ